MDDHWEHAIPEGRLHQSLFGGDYMPTTSAKAQKMARYATGEHLDQIAAAMEDPGLDPDLDQRGTAWITGVLLMATGEEDLNDRAQGLLTELV